MLVIYYEIFSLMFYVRQELAGRQALYLMDMAKSHSRGAHETRRESARF